MIIDRSIYKYLLDVKKNKSIIYSDNTLFVK